MSRDLAIAEAQAGQVDKTLGRQVDLQRIDPVQDAVNGGELGGLQGPHEGRIE